MAPLPVIADVMRLTLGWHNTFGFDAVNVMHFEAPGKSEEDLFTALGANLTSAMVQTMSQSTLLLYFDIIKLDGVSGAVRFDLDGTFDGQGSTDMSPAVCALVSLRTGLRGPRHRGRLYLPYVAEGSQAGGFLDNTQRTTQSTAWNDFALAMALDGFNLGVASYAHSDFNPVLSPVTVESRVATQRRRVGR